VPGPSTTGGVSAVLVDDVHRDDMRALPANLLFIRKLRTPQPFDAYHGMARTQRSDGIWRGEAFKESRRCGTHRATERRALAVMDIAANCAAPSFHGTFHRHLATSRDAGSRPSGPGHS
jgi:hypothetical protein